MKYTKQLLALSVLISLPCWGSRVSLSIQKPVIPITNRPELTNFKEEQKAAITRKVVTPLLAKVPTKGIHYIKKSTPIALRQHAESLEKFVTSGKKTPVKDFLTQEDVKSIRNQIDSMRETLPTKDTVKTDKKNYEQDALRIQLDRVEAQLNVRVSKIVDKQTKTASDKNKATQAAADKKVASVQAAVDKATKIAEKKAAAIQAAADKKKALSNRTVNKIAAPFFSKSIKGTGTVLVSRTENDYTVAKNPASLIASDYATYKKQFDIAFSSYKKDGSSDSQGTKSLNKINSIFTDASRELDNYAKTVQLKMNQLNIKLSNVQQYDNKKEIKNIQSQLDTAQKNYKQALLTSANLKILQNVSNKRENTENVSQISSEVGNTKGYSSIGVYVKDLQAVRDLKDLLDQDAAQKLEAIILDKGNRLMPITYKNKEQVNADIAAFKTLKDLGVVDSKQVKNAIENNILRSQSKLEKEDVVELQNSLLGKSSNG